LTSKGLLKELRKAVGERNVLSSPEDLVCYSYDATPWAAALPEAVVLPSSAEEVAHILRLASRAGLSVIPRGAGTNLSGGTIPVPGSLVVVLTRMDRILEVDEENLTATVEPGVITAKLHAAVEGRGLFYPPDPASVSVCTMGGNVAECAGGLRARKYGVTRDYLLGLETVLPSGEVMVSGGKTIKNVAGYDLTRLMAGSEGTLGIFTKIIVKLLPLPPAKKTLLALYGDLEAAAATVSATVAERILPATLEFLDQVTIRCVEAHARIGLPQDVAAMLLIEVDGQAASVEEETERLARICTRHHALSVRVAQSREEAESLTLARRSALAALARVRPTTVLEDATVPPSRLPELVAEIARIAAKYQLQVGTFGHAGDGNLHPTFLTDERDKEEMARVERAIREVFEVTLKLGGTISGEHGIGIAKAQFLPLEITPPGLSAMRLIKKALDPNDILNPGKIFTDKAP